MTLSLYTGAESGSVFLDNNMVHSFPSVRSVHHWSFLSPIGVSRLIVIRLCISYRMIHLEPPVFFDKNFYCMWCLNILSVRVVEFLSGALYFMIRNLCRFYCSLFDSVTYSKVKSWAYHE